MVAERLPTSTLSSVQVHDPEESISMIWIIQAPAELGERGSLVTEALNQLNELRRDMKAQGDGFGEEAGSPLGLAQPQARQRAAGVGLQHLRCSG